MVGEGEAFGSFLLIGYGEFLQSLPLWEQKFINLFLLSFLIVIYSILILKFYKWISKKDIFELNLAQYNTLQHEGLSKTFAGLIYFIEYLIILPLIIFIWFSVFTIFLMLLTENLEIQAILIASVTMITAIRITAYYKENLSLELAKLFPLTLLAVAITQGILSFEKVISQLAVIPSFLDSSGIYLLFILSIEFLLRIIDTVFSTGEIADKEEN